MSGLYKMYDAIPSLWEKGAMYGKEHLLSAIAIIESRDGQERSTPRKDCVTSVLDLRISRGHGAGTREGRSYGLAAPQTVEQLIILNKKHVHGRTG